MNILKMSALSVALAVVSASSWSWSWSYGENHVGPNMVMKVPEAAKGEIVCSNDYGTNHRYVQRIGHTLRDGNTTCRPENKRLF